MSSPSEYHLECICSIVLKWLFGLRTWIERLEIQGVQISHLAPSLQTVQSYKYPGEARDHMLRQNRRTFIGTQGDAQIIRWGVF